MSKKNHAQARRNLRRQGNLLASEALATASDLREALRPVVAFRGVLEKATTDDQLITAIMTTNLPEKITRVLDIHQNLMLALAMSAKAHEPDKAEEMVQEELREATQSEVLVVPKASFLDD